MRCRSGNSRYSLDNRFHSQSQACRHRRSVTASVLCFGRGRTTRISPVVTDSPCASFIEHGRSVIRYSLNHRPDMPFVPVTRGVKTRAAMKHVGITHGGCSRLTSSGKVRTKGIRQGPTTIRSSAASRVREDSTLTMPRFRCGKPPTGCSTLNQRRVSRLDTTGVTYE